MTEQMTKISSILRDVHLKDGEKKPNYLFATTATLALMHATTLDLNT